MPGQGAPIRAVLAPPVTGRTSTGHALTLSAWAATPSYQGYNDAFARLHQGSAVPMRVTWP